jgi:hypothetical protein
MALLVLGNEPKGVQNIKKKQQQIVMTEQIMNTSKQNLRSWNISVS